jgi:amino acid transporter
MASAHKLKANALGLWDAVIIGLASSGPAQTMAVSLAAIVAASGYAGLLPIVLSFVPMVGIAIGYQRLNRWDPSCGATYSWVARTMSAYLGFLAGWMILLYYTLGTSSLTVPAGTYTLQLIDPHLVSSNVAVGIAGGLWDVAVTLLAVAGIKLAARFQWVLSIFEYLVLLTFAAIAAWELVHGHAAVAVSRSWFTLQGAGGIRGLIAGILIAIFMYSGWDASIYVAEETTDQQRNPGRAAIASVVILLFLYGIVTFTYQGIVPNKVLQAHAGNALAVIAARLAHGGPWSTVMSLIVLTGTVASLQAAIISAARLGLAMAADRVMPRSFERVNPANGSPWLVTLVMGLVNLAFLGLSLTGSIATALSNVVSALGIIAALFYALTGAAAIWAFRHDLARSPAQLVLGGVLPAIGVVFLLWVIVESVLTHATTPTVLAYGLGSIAVGVVVALAIRVLAHPPFFTQRRVGQA